MLSFISFISIVILKSVINNFINKINKNIYMDLFCFLLVLVCFALSSHGTLFILIMSWHCMMKIRGERLMILFSFPKEELCLCKEDRGTINLGSC